MSPEEKQQHSLQNCKACATQHHTLSLAFPCKRKKPAIFFNESELSTPKRFGHKALQELNGITQEKCALTAQQVFCETPKSQLCKKPTSNERKTERRRVEKEIKDDIQKQMDEHGAQTVMQNRISWSVFDKIRKTEGLGVPPKRKQQDDSENTPPTKRKRHGCKQENLAIDTTKLLEEARMWTPEEKVNWSQLATRYSLTSSNRGQVIKEFLKDQHIPAASIVQRVSNTPR